MPSHHTRFRQRRSASRGAMLALLLAVPATLHAGAVTVFTDIDEWRLAASGVGTGVITELDFETLPDGSPTPFQDSAFITPEFNYTDFGVTFSSPVPNLVAYDSGTGGVLSALHHLGSSGGQSWIVADFVIPATAIGILFPGGTTLSLFDNQGESIGEFTRTLGGDGIFLGVVSDALITSAIINRGTSFEILESFLFTPVPEPGSLLLLGAGALTLLARKRR